MKVTIGSLLKRETAGRSIPRDWSRAGLLAAIAPGGAGVLVLGGDETEVAELAGARPDVSVSTERSRQTEAPSQPIDVVGIKSVDAAVDLLEPLAGELSAWRPVVVAPITSDEIRDSRAMLDSLLSFLPGYRVELVETVEGDRVDTREFCVARADDPGFAGWLLCRPAEDQA